MSTTKTGEVDESRQVFEDRRKSEFVPLYPLHGVDPPYRPVLVEAAPVASICALSPSSSCAKILKAGGLLDVDATESNGQFSIYARASSPSSIPWSCGSA